jgi:hypothetical protein
MPKPQKLSTFKKFKMIIARIIATFVANALAIIGAGSLIGVDIVSAVMLAGSLGVIKVIEGLARSYLDDGHLSLQEINDVFTKFDKK